MKPDSAGTTAPATAAHTMPFDQHGRYQMIREAVDACRHLPGLARPTLLDVGGFFLHRGIPTLPLTVFLPDDDVTVLDRVAASASLPRYVQGDGRTLAFDDGAFDLVVSCDTLEHVPAAQRAAFWSELLRVARHGVLLAAPFASPAVELAEQVLADYVRAELGVEQEQLREHRDYGLPRLEEWRDFLAQQGCAVRSYPSGYLHAWLGMMLLKHLFQRISPHTEPLLDDYYIRCFLPNERREPAYRHLIVASRDATLVDAVDITLAPTMVDPANTAALDPTTAWEHTTLPMLLALAQRQAADAHQQQQAALHTAIDHLRRQHEQQHAALEDLTQRAAWLAQQNRDLLRERDAIRNGRLMRILTRLTGK